MTDTYDMERLRPASRATAKSTGNQMLGFFAELMAYFETVGEMGDPAEAGQLLGAPTTTLDEWMGVMATEMPQARSM